MATKTKTKVAADYDVIAPLLFKDPDFAPSKNHSDKISIEQFKNDEADLDYWPAYQRGDDVWPRQYKAALILSLMNGVEIPAIHTVRKEAGKPEAHVMDGKQRGTSIHGYFNNLFPIPLRRSSNGKRMLVYWSKLENDPSLSHLKKKLLRAQLTLTVWEPMDTLACKKIFTQINHSSSLSTHERIYCPNFLTRFLMRNLFDYTMTNLKNHLSGPTRNGHRFKDVRAMHELAMLCYGPDLQTDCKPRGLRTNDVYNSAEQIHDWLLSKGISEKTNLTDAVLQRLAILDKRNKIRVYADAFSAVILSEPALVVHYEARNIIDPLAWMIQKDQQGLLTEKQITNDKKKFANLLLAFSAEKNVHDLNRSTTDPDKMRLKFDLLTNLFNTPDYVKRVIESI